MNKQEQINTIVHIQEIVKNVETQEMIGNIQNDQLSYISDRNPKYVELCEYLADLLGSLMVEKIYGDDGDGRVSWLQKEVIDFAIKICKEQFYLDCICDLDKQEQIEAVEAVMYIVTDLYDQPHLHSRYHVLSRELNLLLRSLKDEEIQNLGKE